MKTPEYLKRVSDLVAKHVMQDKPIVLQYASNDGGKSVGITINSFGGDTNELRDWIEEHPGYELCQMEVYRLYTQNILQAWKVVEKLNNMISDNGDYYTVSLEVNALETLCVINELEDKRVEVREETAPLSICLAALKVMDIEVKE